MELATIFGSAGVVALLVGLVGGNFKFAGSTMPAVGRVARGISFGVGSLLALVAIGLATTGEQPSAPAADASVVQNIRATSAGNPEPVAQDSVVSAAAVTTRSPTSPAAVPVQRTVAKKSPATHRTVAATRTRDAATAEQVTATVVAAPGYPVAFLLPNPTTEGITDLGTLPQLKPGARVALECYVEGETLAPTGVGDDLWYKVAGGYVSDLWLTATDKEVVRVALLPMCP